MPSEATLLIVCNSLNHGAEDIRVDLLPVEVSGLNKITARDAAETRSFYGVTKQTAVYVWKAVRPSGQAFLSAGHLDLG